MQPIPYTDILPPFMSVNLVSVLQLLHIFVVNLILTQQSENQKSRIVGTVLPQVHLPALHSEQS